MKSLITAIIFLFLSTCGHAQEWAPVGAKWYYGSYSWNPPGLYFVELRMEGSVVGVKKVVKERLKNNFDFLSASFGAMLRCEYSP